jgi:hypothetical protein
MLVRLSWETCCKSFLTLLPSFQGSLEEFVIDLSFPSSVFTSSQVAKLLEGKAKMVSRS